VLVRLKPILTQLQTTRGVSSPSRVSLAWQFGPPAGGPQQKPFGQHLGNCKLIWSVTKDDMRERERERERGNHRLRRVGGRGGGHPKRSLQLPFVCGPSTRAAQKLPCTSCQGTKRQGHLTNKKRPGWYCLKDPRLPEPLHTLPL